MSGVWKRSYGRPTKAPPDERGGNRHGRPNTTAPHPDSTRSSAPSHLIGLAGPTSLRLNRMDLPCSRCFLWLHAGGTEPREHLRPLALSRPAIPPSPLSDRVGYSDHVRFRGYIPVHFIPAYNLPVYASQRPLPDATQDSVRGCSLGFAAAVITDGRLQRACKAQRSSNRTCSFPASGFPTGFITRHTSATLCARGSAQARQGFHRSHGKTV
jgi:hypothetical protein